MLWRLLLQSTKETLWMVGVSVTLAVIGGLPLGVLLVTTTPGNVTESPLVYKVLTTVVNIGRSIPFIILLVAIIPFTRLVVGTSIGTTAAIVPLTVAAIPFVARIVESALKDVDKGVVEAAQAMGASPWQIIIKVLLPEALPTLVLGVTITAVNLIGYSAMAGAVGGGGLGDLAIRYGYQRFRGDVMLMTVVVLVLLVEVVQSLGDWAAETLNKK
ncbi:MAG: ABC transporter permease [Firmicutes bacterium]|nr:ABC transporter permease [Bacillota bacterium]